MIDGRREDAHPGGAVLLFSFIHAWLYMGVRERYMGVRRVEGGGGVGGGGLVGCVCVIKVM